MSNRVTTWKQFSDSKDTQISELKSSLREFEASNRSLLSEKQILAGQAAEAEQSAKAALTEVKIVQTQLKDAKKAQKEAELKAEETERLRECVGMGLEDTHARWLQAIDAVHTLSETEKNLRDASVEMSLNQKRYETRIRDLQRMLAAAKNGPTGMLPTQMPMGAGNTNISNQNTQNHPQNSSAPSSSPGGNNGGDPNGHRRAKTTAGEEFKMTKSEMEHV